jgi:hypothetical protein
MPRDFAPDLFHQKAASQHLMPARRSEIEKVFLLTASLSSWWQKAKRKYLIL